MSTTELEVWWLDGGDARCEYCLQRYAIELEVRCAECDAGLCTHCAVRVVRESSERYCVGCTPDDAGETG